MQVFRLVSNEVVNINGGLLMSGLQNFAFFRYLGTSLMVGFVVIIQFFSPQLHAEDNSISTHSLSRFCWPTEVMGPLGEPEDAIQDIASQLSLNGNHAELSLMIRPSLGGPFCRKTFEGTISKFPTKIVFTSLRSTCDANVNQKETLEQPVTLMNSDSDETNGRIFWVDDKHKSEALGRCPSSYLMYRIYPIIL